MQPLSRSAALFLLAAVLLLAPGCLLTRVLTMPMRVGGAATTIIPVGGDVIHKGVDEAADVIDKAPL